MKTLYIIKIPQSQNVEAWGNETTDEHAAQMSSELAAAARACGFEKTAEIDGGTTSGQDVWTLGEAGEEIVIDWFTYWGGNGTAGMEAFIQSQIS
jgi:hypothetical protein